MPTRNEVARGSRPWRWNSSAIANAYDGVTMIASGARSTIRRTCFSVWPPDPRTPHSPDEWIRRYATLPLMYQPGERWQYNTGSLVLGVLVARASGGPLEDFFRIRIFEPLAMNVYLAAAVLFKGIEAA